MNGNEPIATIETGSKISLPIWSVSHYLDTFMNSYLKLVTLREICNRFIEGATNDNFVISVNSYDMFPEIPDYENDNDLFFKTERIIQSELKILTTKEQSPRDFWYYFKYLHRPIVLFRSGNEFTPLYEIDSNNALRINNLTLQSPVSFSLQGVLGILIDLFSGNMFAQRANERNAQALANIEGIVRTSHLIEDERTPAGVRHFASDQLEAVMNKQANINRKLGINEYRILE